MNTQLQQAIIEQSGGQESWDEIRKDIASYGIDGGFSGWIYYHETSAFYLANERAIDSLLADQAQEYGQSSSELLASFRCLDISQYEADLFLMGHIDEDNEESELQDCTLCQIHNALAWFAVEHLAFMQDC